MQKKFTLPKAERLCSKKQIDKLFEKGSEANNSLFSYPFRVVYTKQAAQVDEFPQIVISVSKRNFKKAVHRNTLKRRIKEAYRLNKFKSFPTFKPKHFVLMYLNKEILSFQEIQDRLILLFAKIDETEKSQQKLD